MADQTKNLGLIKPLLGESGWGSSLNQNFEKIDAAFTSHPVRQSVLSGRTDAAGYANFLEAGEGFAVTLRASDTPVAISFAAGFRSGGPIDFLGVIDQDVEGAWILPVGVRAFLFVERNSSTGEFFFGYSLTPPVYGAGLTEVSYFDLKEFKFKDQASEKQRVFVGEAVAGESGLTSVITYALQGRYDSGWFPVSRATDYVKNHHLGIPLWLGASVRFYFSPMALDTDASYALDLYLSGAHGVGHYVKENTQQDTRNQIWFGFGSYVQLFRESSRVSGYYRIIIERGW